MAEPRGYLVVPVGFDPSGDIRALELDADDAVLMAFESAAKGLVGTHGWIGGAWQKSPLPIGYSGADGANVEDTNLSAGAVTVLSAAVPSGEFWLVSNLCFRYVGTSPAEVLVLANIGGVNRILWAQDAPESGAWYDKQGQWVIPPEGRIGGYIIGATAGDDFRLDFIYTRVDIDQ